MLRLGSAFVVTRNMTAKSCNRVIYRPTNNHQYYSTAQGAYHQNVEGSYG